MANLKLGQTQFLRSIVNGRPEFTTAPFGGNIPTGATQLTREQFGTQLKAETIARLAKGERDIASGKTKARYDTSKGIFKTLSDFEAGIGVFAQEFEDPTFGKFKPDAPTPSEKYLKPEFQKPKSEYETFFEQGMAEGKSPDEISQSFAQSKGLASAPSQIQLPTPTLGSQLPEGLGEDQEGLARSKSGEYYKIGDDVFEAATDRKIEQPEFQEKGLNFNLLPEGKYYKEGDTVYNPQGQEIDPSEFQQRGLNFDLLPSGVGGAPAGGVPTEGAPGFTSTGNEELDAVLEQMAGYVKTIEAQGKQINPSLEISPDVIKQFLTQAETEINPYYASQIKAIKGDLEESLSTLQKSYTLAKEERESTFKRGLGVQREAEAGAGLAFSGPRARREEELRGSTERSLESLGQRTEAAAQAAGRGVERTIGSLGLTPGFEAPEIGTTGVSLAGRGGFTTGATRRLYTPEGGVTGSLEREKITAVQRRRGELESAERSRRALNFYQ